MPILFDAEDKSLHDILFGKDKYKIPRYQRPYSWTKDEVAELWSDLIDNEASFLGSFVFNYEFATRDKFIEVIDGQQRLITLTILSAVLRDLYRDLKDEKKADLTQTSIIEFRDNITGDPTYRLKCGDTLVRFFEKNVQASDAHTLSSRPYRKEEKRVKENYEFLREQISTELEQISEIKNKIDYLDSLKKKLADLKIIWIRIDSDNDAYSIFETVNARGADLTAADLLKNYLFSKIHNKEEGIDSAKESWINIENNVEGAKGLSVSKLIRYHWLSKYGFVSEKNLYKEIKKIITDPESFLAELEQSSDYYFKMTNPEVNEKTWQAEVDDSKSGLKIYEALRSLSTMGITQSYPLLLCLLANREKIGMDLSPIFKTIEKYHFVYSAVCKQPGNKVEKIYFQTARKIQEALKEKNSKKVRGAVERALQEFKARLEVPSRDLFIEKFMEIEYKNYPLVVYILSNLEKAKGGTDEQIVNFSKVNIEHILPKDPTEWKLKKQDIKDYVNNLGNLTLISQRINGSMGNQSLKNKIAWIKKSKLHINKELVKKIKSNGKWGQKEIADRQREIAEFAHDFVWKI
jgi:uncharacterized protein with ParB-like and HNH nuclease domain